MQQNPLLICLKRNLFDLTMKKTIVLYLSLFLFITPLFSQRSMADRSAIPKIGRITGLVLDNNSQHSIEYANVALYSSRDSSVVAGTVTDTKGRFKLEEVPPGRYYLYVKFIGYDVKIINDIRINQEKASLDLGTVVLFPATENIQGVEVVAERSQVLYKLDKKIVNPGTIISSQGGSAVDVLENTPSVTVDIEGNVSLRGSGNFLVLIDGRPSPLDPTDALQQIPASSIENIEIITNPSAKFDPDGTSGIINIISKKNKLEGISGQINLNGDSKEAFGGDFLVSYRNSKFNAFLGANYNDRKMTGSSIQENENIYNDTTLFTQSYGDRNMNRLSKGIKAGLDYSITEKDVLSFSGTVGKMTFERGSNTNFTEFTDPESYFLESYSEDISSRTGEYYNGNIMYQHKFNTEGHQLEASVNLRGGNSGEESLNEKSTLEGVMQLGQKSTEQGKDQDLRIKADYVYPINEKYKVEAGYQSRIENETEDYRFFTMDLISSEYVNLEPYNNHSTYQRNIHAMYGMFSGEYKKFSYQLGLRGEYTDRIMEHEGAEDPFVINRIDLFPTLHSAFQLPADQQMFINYARRIERPRNFYLEPFYAWMDAYNIRVGNPGLIPEYIDSYELGYHKQFKNAFFSLEGYLRQTHNKIERTRTVYEANIMLNSFENVGTDYSSGIETMYNGKISKWWSMNISGNLFYYVVKGELYGKEFEKTSTNYGGRISNTFTITPTTRVQLDGMYNGPSVTAQGTREAFAFSNIALKQQFFDRNLTLTFQVSDIFNTGKHEAYIYGENYSSYYKFGREAPIYRATLTWNFNNYRPDKKTKINGDSGEMEMDDF